MDWRKTKTILIYTLLFINIVLIGVLIQGNVTDFFDQNNRLESVLEIFNQKGVEVPSSLLKQPNTVPKVNLTYDAVNHKKLAEKLMLEDYEFVEDEKMYKSENFQLQVLPDSVIFSPVGTFEIAPAKDKLSPIEKANILMLEMGFKDDYELVNHIIDDEKVILEYTQVINNNYLEDTFMKFIIQDGNIMRFERKWFSTLEYLNESVEIVPIDRMLFQLLVSLTDDDLAIKDIEIVYRLESTMSNILLSGEGTPYFQITMENGNVYYEHATNKFYNP